MMVCSNTTGVAGFRTPAVMSPADQDGCHRAAKRAASQEAEQAVTAAYFRVVVIGVHEATAETADGAKAAILKSAGSGAVSIGGGLEVASYNLRLRLA